MKAWFNAVVVLAVAAILLAWWVEHDFTSPGALSEAVTLVFAPGTHFDEIADALAEKGVVSHPLLFKAQVFLRGQSSRFKAGEYTFPGHISPAGVADMIANGRAVKHHLTIVEGMMTAEILELVRKEPALSGDITLDIREGELLPETYVFSLGDKRNDMLLRMKHAMQKVVEEAWAGRQNGLPITSPFEAVTLASIVEKETALSQERAHVASVYVNRLHKGMLLQADPTTAYAVTEGKYRLDRALTYKDLATNSPYNTYRTLGLPPSPIANPGKASLQAALHPLATEDLYFVANGKGGHNFAATLAAHDANVKAYRDLQRVSGK